MRRMAIEKLCGVDWEEDRREVTAVFSETISLGGGKAKDLDLCEKHAEIPISLLRPTVERYGTDRLMPAVKQPKRRTTTPAADLTCTVKGCTSGPGGGPFEARTPGGLGLHKRRTHKIGVSGNKAERQTSTR